MNPQRQLIGCLLRSELFFSHISLRPLPAALRENTAKGFENGLEPLVWAEKIGVRRGRYADTPYFLGNNAIDIRPQPI